MYKQLIMPLVATSAIASYCLLYVENTINVPSQYRTLNAQIAHDQAKEKNWVHENQDYPKNVWFIMFWSIDNGDYQGQGHVAIAFVDNNGAMQIHDSEVHRGAREPYKSLAELENWFGSVGTKMTFLGWSEGVDSVKVIDEIKAETKTEIKKTDKKKEQLKIYGYPFFLNKDGSVNKNIFFKIDFG
ncbi:hypothetical protein [Pseudolactococcus raffinolactis]|uniref:hypothetical protein n=1 Tax=Pseudolactococcus raffinolactis TaxID=1366 RepID=UPI000BB4CE20|nr:hypothetical protein [Lactococcus raffinolactis]ATC60411.1 hypothetical protein CMV25_00280 [Lactococcus raffinolactis]